MAHTATALTDGRVLIAGGFTDPRGAAWGAELYDPEHDQFLPAAPLRVLRHSHSATRLASGEVLLAGGFTASGQPGTAAEVYDPRTGTTTLVGSLQHPRAGHVAVLLLDGRVLIAGGVGPEWRFLSSVEMYDPHTRRFTVVAPMAQQRESHVGVLLRDGRVLVLGGHRGRRAEIEIHASAEVFDPARGTWIDAGRMTVPRHKHDAVSLADGRVLVLGGSDERIGVDAYRSTEVYDPRTQRFAPGPMLQRARDKHQGTTFQLRSRDVLVAGGAADVESCRLDVPQCVLLRTTPPMGGSFSAAAPLADGGILITGGYGSGTPPRALSWRYRP